MMKRYLLSIILGFLAMTNFSYGQVEINFASQTANANGTVDIDVTTNGFTGISTVQFSAGWDSLVMKFNSVTFTNPTFPDLSANNVSGPVGSSNVDSGQFTFSYTIPTLDGTLPDGSILFTARFDIIGNECDETPIDLTGDPAGIEITDSDFNELTVTSESGEILINGADCGTGGGEITFTAPTVNAEQGTSICLPVTVTNFTDIQNGMGTILWDPSVISYTNIANAALVGSAAITLNEVNTDSGELKFLWENLNPGNPLSIPDGDFIFELCFDVSGSVGAMSPITLSTEGNLGFEWDSDTVISLPQILTAGKVTIIESVGDVVTLTISDITINEDATTACVDISVENFDNILGSQYVITWDETILSNGMPTNFNLAGLNAGSFNVSGNSATLSWSGVNGVNLADGTVIYSMCFDVIGDCDNTAVVDIISEGSTGIEFLDGSTNVVPSAINAGSVFVMCIAVGGDCEVLSVDKTCIGESGGNIIVNVETNNCMYSWANGAGVEVSTDKNLLGVPAGTYILTVMCDGMPDCVITETVENFADLDIDGDITNAACGDLGAINVTVALGSGDYSYNWNPAQGDTPNISDLEPGPYQLTVTDNDNNCTKSTEFQVINEVDDLEIVSSVVVDETCVEMDGRISLTIDGGCEPYSFEWSDTNENSPIRTNLIAGNYLVTVTDDSSPANTTTGSFTVDGFTIMMLDGAPNINSSTGVDGSITIMITGGTVPYNYNWEGPTAGLPNSNMISGLMPGDYNVTVTDDSGCQAFFGPFNVLLDVIGATNVKIGSIQAVDNEDGFSVLCNGDSNGVISGNITEGAKPFTVVLSGDESRTFELEDIGVFMIGNLSAGTYTVTVSNTFNSVSEENIIISEPDALTSAIETGCDNEEQCDGFIDLNISGGSGLLSYDWNDTNLSGASLNDLCEGNYAVLITDENGCQIMESVEIEPCQGPVDPDCYQVRDVITPNGDGMNDQFTITCISDFPATLEVYDRWGKLVFNQAQYDGSWMGVSNSNEMLIEGGYMYIINIDFGQGRREIMKGTLTLLRD